MNYVFLIFGIVSYIVYSWIAIVVIKFRRPLRIMYVITALVFLDISIVFFRNVKKKILYDTTQTYIVQENKDTLIPYKYKIEEITVKEYRDKSWITNDWKENSQQFKKEEKVIYSNDLPNGKYTFMEQEK